MLMACQAGPEIKFNALLLVKHLSGSDLSSWPSSSLWSLSSWFKNILICQGKRTMLKWRPLVVILAAYLGHIARAHNTPNIILIVADDLVSSFINIFVTHSCALLVFFTLTLWEIALPYVSATRFLSDRGL